MPTERAGYTVTMFLVDTSPSMGNMRTVRLPHGTDGQEIVTEMTNLEWALQFVKIKMQEMIYNGRKTDQCGVILFGSEGTDNIINDKKGGYEHVSEFISIAPPNAGTLAKLDALEPSTVIGDPVDALIVGIETQQEYLIKKKSWTRKVVIVTDGQNPIEVEDWEDTVKKMDSYEVGLTIIGVDFDDDELPYYEENKPNVKRANEEFYKTLTSSMKNGIVGTCALALREAARPDIKQTKSALMGTVLRLGDVENRPDEAVELSIKSCKCTSLSRPKSWKKFGRREATNDDDAVEQAKAVFAQLKMRTEYYIDRSEDHDDDDVQDDAAGVDADGDQVMKDEETKDKTANLEKVEKEQLIRGFKYGATYVPCPDGQFPRLNTKRGIDICGFFHAKNFRRELSLGEIQYIWADTDQPQQQVALSSIVQAMYEKDVMAIARWVSKDGMDPKMGVLAPCVFEKVDCLLWAHMPFADDVRKYTFASLDNLVSKNGQVITNHPYIPTEEQLSAMDKFVDAMDIMEAGEKDDEGNRGPWFDTRFSYSPAIHRTKQAQFHCAIVSDITSNPLPPPHPELLKFFEPPKKVLKRAKQVIEECQRAFKVKEVPKRVARQRKDGHVHAQGDDEEMLLLDRMPPKRTHSQSVSQVASSSKRAKTDVDDSDTEEDEEDLLLDAKPAPPAPNASDRLRALPTPARSMSPNIDPGRAPGRIIGSTYPLADFKKNIAQGDVVSKAVEDLSAVITEIVMEPFSSRRTAELLECMKVFRETSLKEDEIDAWNGFLTNLKQECTSEPGNLAFWSHVQKEGRCMSLISDVEAAKHGGKSAVSERKSEKFLAA